MGQPSFSMGSTTELLPALRSVENSLFPESSALSFLEPRGKMQDMECRTGKLLAYSEGNSLAQSQQQTFTKHTEMLQHLSAKYNYSQYK